MFKHYMRWRCIGLSHRKTWTEHDSYDLCRSLAIILPSGRVDWVQCGRMTDILSGRVLSKSEQQFKQFLTQLVMYRFAWWDGQCVYFSDYPRGRDAAFLCCMALAAVKKSSKDPTFSPESSEFNNVRAKGEAPDSRLTRSIPLLYCVRQYPGNLSPAGVVNAHIGLGSDYL